MDTVTLPGLHLATAWLNCSLASSDDDNRPVLYRTLLVERFRHGVQLVATDSHLLLGSFIPTAAGDLDPPPSIDDAPISSTVVVDRDKRMSSLMAYVLKEATAAAKNEMPFDVTLSTASAEADHAPTLDPSLDRAMFVAEIEAERLALPIYEGDFPTWRALLGATKPKPTGRSVFAPQLLGVFGKLRNLGAPIVMEYAGPTGMVALSAPGCETYLFGGLMPMGDGPGE